jgi:hydrogenase expression/formation protein HypC
MCLGIPGKIIEVYQSGSLMMGKIDYGGIFKEACLAYVPEAQVGDYVLVHAGFAISRMMEEDAQETLKLLGEIAASDQELRLGQEDDPGGFARSIPR